MLTENVIKKIKGTNKILYGDEVKKFFDALMLGEVIEFIDILEMMYSEDLEFINSAIIIFKHNNEFWKCKYDVLFTKCLGFNHPIKPISCQITNFVRYKQNVKPGGRRYEKLEFLENQFKNKI